MKFSSVENETAWKAFIASKTNDKPMSKSACLPSRRGSRTVSPAVPVNARGEEIQVKDLDGHKASGYEAPEMRARSSHKDGGAREPKAMGKRAKIAALLKLEGSIAPDKLAKAKAILGIGPSVIIRKKAK